MKAEYITVYEDDIGIENVVIHNDGEMISTVIREVKFEGNDFDQLEPTEELKSNLF